MPYYYLSATLPHLPHPGALRDLDVEEAIETIIRNLEPADRVLVDYLLYPADIQNLVNLLWQRQQETYEFQWQTPSVFDQEQLETGLTQAYSLPDFMSTFLEGQSGSASRVSIGQMSSLLEEAFYQEVQSLDHAFIEDYFRYEKLVKSVALGINQRLHGLDLDGLNLGETEHASLILGEEATAMRLTESYGFYESLTEAIRSQLPEAIERCMDELLWQFADEYEIAPFSRDHIFRYVIMLLKVQRWSVLEKEKDIDHLTELLLKIENQSKNLNHA